jgi:hypothetical protein
MAHKSEKICDLRHRAGFATGSAMLGNRISIVNQHKKTREGRLQRQIRRAFIASDGAPLRLRDLLGWCYARSTEHPAWRVRGVHTALPRWAVLGARVGWALRAE